MSNLIFITDNDNNVGIGSNMINDIKGNINITQNLNVSGNLNVINGGMIKTTGIGSFGSINCGVGTFTSIGIGTTSNRTTLDVGGTDGIIIPTGNTTQRPTNPMLGTIRYNSLINRFEGYCAGFVGLSAGWVHLGGPFLNPYTTTDYRHYMWEENNVPGVTTQGNEAYVFLRTLNMKTYSVNATVHMEGVDPWWGVPPAHQGSYGIDHTDNNTYPDEHIWKIVYQSTPSTTPVFNIINTHNDVNLIHNHGEATGDRRVYIEALGNNQWAIKPYYNPNQYLIYNNLDVGTAPLYSSMQLAGNPPNPDQSTFEFIYFREGVFRPGVGLDGVIFNPYPTTDYRYYMWEANNTPLLFGQIRGDRALVTMRSLFMKTVSLQSTVHIEGNYSVMWSNGSYRQDVDTGNGVIIDHTDNTNPPDEHIFRIQYDSMIGLIPLFKILNTNITSVRTTERNFIHNWHGPGQDLVRIVSTDTNQWEIIPQIAQTKKFFSYASLTYNSCVLVDNPPTSDAANYTWEFNYI